MKRLQLFGLAVAASLAFGALNSPAFATGTGNGPNCTGNQNCNTYGGGGEGGAGGNAEASAAAAAAANASSSSVSGASATGGNATATGGAGGNATAGAISGGNTLQGGNTSVDASSDTDVDAEPAYAPSIGLTSGPDCIGSFSASGGGGGLFAIGVGGTNMVDGCEARALSQLVRKYGDDASARWVLCNRHPFLEGTDIPFCNPTVATGGEPAQEMMLDKSGQPKAVEASMTQPAAQTVGTADPSAPAFCNDPGGKLAAIETIFAKCSPDSPAIVAYKKKRGVL